MKNKLPPFGLIIAVILLYLGVFTLSRIHKNYAIRADSLGYFALSENLLLHHTFSSDLTSPQTPELFRLPGYPVFLFLIGAHTQDDFARVILAQCLIGVLLLFAVWKTLVKLAGLRGAIVGGAILSLDLVTALHAPLILPELLLQLFIVGGLVSAVVWTKDHSTRALIFSALCWGVAALIKPIALFIPPIIFVIHIFDLKNAVLFLLLAFLLPVGWSMRNSMIVGKPLYTSQGGYALLLYPAANAYAMAQHIDIDTAVAQLEKKIHDENPGLVKNSSLESVAYKQEAMRVMKAYPLQTAHYCTVGAIRILGGGAMDLVADLLNKKGVSQPAAAENSAHVTGTGTWMLLKMNPELIPIEALYMVFLVAGYLFFLLGSLRLFWSGEIKLTLLFTLPFLALLAIACHQGYYRYRIPMIPFAAFGAACFFIRSGGKSA